MKRVLVTGANGYVGKKLKELLQKQGFEVVSTDLIGRVDFIGNLLDVSFVKSLPEVDGIVNCAAVQYVSNNIPIIGRNKYFLTNNVTSLQNLRKKYDGSIKFFIQFGSSMMFRKNENGCYDADSQFGDNGIYSQSKIAAFNEYQNFNCASAFIIPTIIGGYARKGFFESIGKMMKSYNIAVMPGACSSITSIVHVDDVCELIHIVLKNQSEGIFNVASNDLLSINDWVDLIAQALGRKVMKINIPLYFFKIIGFLSGYRLLAKEQLLILQYPHSLNLDRAKKLGWQPKKGIKNIIEDTFLASDE